MEKLSNPECGKAAWRRGMLGGYVVNACVKAVKRNASIYE
jgi:hypothetical protein